MNKKILGAVLGLSALMVSPAASAHVDVSVGIGVPGYYAPAPGYVAPPPPVVVGYGYGGLRLVGPQRVGARTSGEPSRAPPNASGARGLLGLRLAPRRY